MKRHTFFAASTLTLALGLGITVGALAQTTMKISISIAQNSHQGVAIDTFAKEVEKRTQGRYKIQPFYSGRWAGVRARRFCTARPSLRPRLPRALFRSNNFTRMTSAFSHKR